MHALHCTESYDKDQLLVQMFVSAVCDGAWWYCWRLPASLPLFLLLLFERLYSTALSGLLTLHATANCSCRHLTTAAQVRLPCHALQAMQFNASAAAVGTVIKCVMCCRRGC
jgi:hypothetical protein